MDRATMQVVFHEINKLDAECEDRFEGESSRRTLRDLSTRLQTLENEYLSKMAEDYEEEQYKKDTSYQQYEQQVAQNAFETKTGGKVIKVSLFARFPRNESDLS